MEAGLLHTNFRARPVLDIVAIPWLASPEPECGADA